MSNQNSALATLADKQRDDLAKRLESQQSLGTFDWKQLPPHIMSQVLMKKPYRGKANEPDYYLTPEQALVFAMRCFELGLSPLSSEVWFDRDRWAVNVTLEGKIRLARERGVVGAPQFEQLERPWRKGITPIAGFEQEPGVKCTVMVGKEPCSYICWLSEWIVPTSPVWRTKPLHMTQVRAYDKTLAFASGVSVSEMPSELEIQPEELPADVQPVSAPVKRIDFSPAVHESRKSQNFDNMEPVLQASIDAAQKK